MPQTPLPAEDQPTATLGDRAGQPTEAGPEPGSSVARYQIVEKVAAGGMGVVYKAFDPELSRHVALKFLHHQQVGVGTQADEYRERLLREAQVLAQLSHPNVVAAFEVGRHDGAVFVAMEFIEGMSARAWIKARARTTPEVLKMLVAAGRGLAAAHAAGLLHRDFKLDNVMVSPDGRVRVVDFGLAKAANADPTSGASPLGPVSSPGSVSTSTSQLSAELTRAGEIVGTAGYIAPEHFTGKQLDLRSDQFSYAATVFRALCGVSPYRNDTMKHYYQAVGIGERVRWSGAVPRKVRRIIDRGLATNPEDRYPTLDTLVDALERTLQGSRPIWKYAIAASAAALLVVGGTWLFRVRCEIDPDAFRAGWDDPQRKALERAFGATGKAYAADTFALVASQLDLYRQRWLTMRKDACEATHLRREQSEQILGLRTRCLDRKRAQVGVLVALLVEADGALVDRSPQTVRELSPLDECADVAALTGENERMPADPTKATAVEKLKRELDALEALSATGRFKDGQSRARKVADEALQLGHLPTRAFALAEEADFLSKLGQPAECEAARSAALELAASARIEELVVRIELAMLLRMVDAEQWLQAKAALPLANASLLSAGSPPELKVRMLTQGAAILAADKQYTAALEQLNLAQRECQTAIPQGSRSCASVTLERGLLFWSEKNHPQARVELEKVIAQTKATLGPMHPRVVADYNNLVELLLEAKDAKGAMAALAEAKRIAAAISLGNKTAAHLPYQEGSIRELAGEWALAVPLFKEAVERFSAAYGPKTYQTSSALRRLGRALSELGQLEEGVRQLQRSVDIRVESAMSAAKRGEALADLARAQWKLPAQQRLAIAHGKEALKLLREDGAESEESAHSLEQWLAERGRK